MEEYTPQQKTRLDLLKKIQLKANTTQKHKRVNVKKVWKIKQLLSEGHSKYFISKQVGVSHETINKIQNGEFDHYPYITRIDLFEHDFEGDCRLGTDARTMEH